MKEQDKKQELLEQGKKQVKSKITKIFIKSVLPWILVIFLLCAIIMQVIDIGSRIAQVAKDFWKDIVSAITVDENGISISDEVLDSFIAKIEEEEGEEIWKQLKLLGDLEDYEADNMQEKLQKAKRKYLRKFLEAQVITQEINRPGQGGLQGRVYLSRTNEGATTAENVIELSYIDLESMEALRQQNDPNIRRYFSLNDNREIVVPRTTKTSTSSSEEGGDGYVEEIVLQTIPYRSLIAQYSTPAQFFIYLGTIIGNPEFLAEFTDIIKEDTSIRLVIVNNVTTTTTTETYTYTPMEKVIDTEEQYNEVTEEWETVPVGYHYEEGSPVTETSTTTVISENPVLRVTYVNTWQIEQTITYERKPDETTTNTTTTGENGIPEIEDEEEGGESYRINQKRTTTETMINQNFDNGTPSDYQYKAGEKPDEHPEYTSFVDLLDKKYKIPNSKEKRWAGQELIAHPELFFTLLQNDTDTQNLENFMRYVMFKYTGNNYGVDSLDFSVFDVNYFRSVSRNGGLLKEYIRKFEGNHGMNEDGTQYVIAYGKTVGYGVDLDDSGYETVVKNMGYSTNIGDSIPVEVIDNIEDEIRENYLNSIKARTSGLDLTEYQIHALVSRAYNCGIAGAVDTNYTSTSSMNFVESYKAYWKEGDDQFEAQNNRADFNHKLYTNFMCKPTKGKDGNGNSVEMPGLKTRRESEWTLFQTGYYTSLNSWYKEYQGGEGILDAAYQVHHVMERTQENWSYSVGTGLYWNNIEMSLNNPNKVTCCATYVSCTLYYGGFLTEAEANSFNYNSATALYNYLRTRGNWETVNSYSSLEAGDIVFMTTKSSNGAIGHVQIYAGGGSWYNAGGDYSIKTANPYTSNDSGRFIVALRLVE